MCDVCRQNPCHSRCPNYIQPKTTHHCSSCGEGIYDGEEYIENMDNEYMHYDCFCGMRELIEWLGYEIKTMENGYE